MCSVYRKSIINDSAYIAGFNESFILNEASALETIHLAARRLCPWTPEGTSVFWENSGNLNLALYSCEANKFVKLLAVTGNRNHCTTSEGTLNHFYVNWLSHKKLLGRKLLKGATLFTAYTIETIEIIYAEDVSFFSRRNLYDYIMIPYTYLNDWIASGKNQGASWEYLRGHLTVVVTKSRR